MKVERVSHPRPETYLIVMLSSSQPCEADVCEAHEHEHEHESRSKLALGVHARVSCPSASTCRCRARGRGWLRAVREPREGRGNAIAHLGSRDVLHAPGACDRRYGYRIFAHEHDRPRRAQTGSTSTRTLLVLRFSVQAFVCLRPQMCISVDLHTLSRR